MEKPRIDILVPLFNPNPEFLRQALDSILHQTEQRFNVFVNDDASDNDVSSVIQPYLQDPRFHFSKNSVRLGIGGNWNECLNVALCAKPGSPFIQYLFQDDRWYFTYLNEMLAVFDTHPTIGFASADHLYDCEKNIPTESLYDNLRTFKNDHLAPGIHQGEKFLQWWLTHQLHPNVIGEPSFVMMRREVVHGMGKFREDMPQFLDVEYWTRLLLCTDWYFHPQELGVFRVHRKAASFINDEQGTGIFDRFRCFQHLLKAAPPYLHRDIEQSRNAALKTMVGKFFDRIHNKTSVSTKGSGTLPGFCLRHPLLIGKAVVKVLRERLAK
ncbi:glycosyltransferase [Candidatus Peregrinibacteria bacterium]|nr:glycosyltransferase [Candidatus Peregrinibacteria bacterium]